MVSPRPARAGNRLDQVETPALVVDLDALEANIVGMAAHAGGANIALRPHAKTHKSVAIASRQHAAGAIGLCCQKVSEAEALLPSGVADILVSNHVIGAEKLARLAGVARRARTTTLISDPRHVAWLSEAATAHGVEFELLIEIDAGDARMGLQDLGSLALLAQTVDRAPGLRLRGLQVYSGPLQHIRSHEQRAAAAREAAARARLAREHIHKAGLACDVISGGGTGSFAADAEFGVLTELQPGSYVFMDGDYGRNLGPDGQPFRPFAQSLFVLTTVLRTPSTGVVYVDAGAKALNLDCGMPEVHGRSDLAFTKAADEQGRIETAPGGRTPDLGERLMLVPSHCDPTVNQFDWMVAMRDRMVEDVWPVDARGCVI